MITSLIMLLLMMMTMIRTIMFILIIEQMPSQIKLNYTCKPKPKPMMNNNVDPGDEDLNKEYDDNDDDDDSMFCLWHSVAFPDKTYVLKLKLFPQHSR